MKQSLSLIFRNLSFLEQNCENEFMASIESCQIYIFLVKRKMKGKKVKNIINNMSGLNPYLR